MKFTDFNYQCLSISIGYRAASAYVQSICRSAGIENVLTFQLATELQAHKLQTTVFQHIIEAIQEKQCGMAWHALTFITI